MASESDVVADEKVVQFHYKLTGEDGELIEETDEDEPVAYLHGAQNIVPGLEEAMEGKVVGDSFDVSVPPQKGYGVRTSKGAQQVPREAFPEEMELVAGMPFFVQSGNDEEEYVQLYVVNVEGDVVNVDADHPLAGRVLHFAVEVVSIRDAQEEEIAHGHPHGPGGHHHH